MSAEARATNLLEFRRRFSADSLPANDVAPASWKLSALHGRIVELASHGASSTLTLATRLVLDAQSAREPVAWITTEERAFYPPDLAASGVDLHALVVVRVKTSGEIARAADQLARSGAFGLLVLDLPKGAVIPSPLLSRLLGLAQKHQAVILCLTEKSPKEASLGSLVSLRAEAHIAHRTRGSFACTLAVTKDKRRAPTWSHEEVCRGPAGMR
jgi:recombination protein RecA